ncbi:C1 family peptidase [Parachryseolinea silvisoli]|uniref:C1 family peptidase n=1 Tax=Parachryseolinea silvisoli TaxID=2873601 RepID=UPI002265B998|nr:C1 family peptidase [Parachryseolinea silvisoli]MCD9018395.1 C1 family peptidase [Parachryseolinea silvisoli]
MKKLHLPVAAVCCGIVWGIVSEACAQGQSTPPAGFSRVYEIPATAVKSQDNTGTCWSFSTTSLVESQTMKQGYGEFDISEMFTVRNIYLEKARNYILRQGAAQFGPGGLGHDVIRAMATYGIVPETAYPGLVLGQKQHDHGRLDTRLKTYLDSLLKIRPVPADWQRGFEIILDDHLGKAPTTFMYQEKSYTPMTFASEVVHFSASDYVNITSFSHHPFYTSFILEAPDNFLNGSYYNLPVNEMITLTERALAGGYSIMWDADVSNSCFRQKDGYAMRRKDCSAPQTINADDTELPYDQTIRQSLYENLTTQDDHLMHLVGLDKTKGGKKFFLVKNSWGKIGPFNGYIRVSESYFAINTVSLVVPKAALDNALRQKLGLR